MAALFLQIQFEYPFLFHLQDSACISDHSTPDERIIFCNEAFTELTGYSYEEILGRNCRFLQGKHTDPKAVQEIRKAIVNGTACEVEILNYRKDGVPFINGFCLLPVHGKNKKDGPVFYFVALQRNVTTIINPFATPMSRWSVPEVCMWLEQINAGSFCKAFMNSNVNGAALERFTSADLASLGVSSTTDQSRILEAIQLDKNGAHVKEEEVELSDEADEEDNFDVSGVELKAKCIQRQRVNGFLSLEVGDIVVLRDHKSANSKFAKAQRGSEQGMVMLSSLDLNPHLGNEYLKVCEPLCKQPNALAALFGSNHQRLEDFVYCLAASGCLFDALVVLFSTEVREKTERGLATEQFRDESPAVAALRVLFNCESATKFASSFANRVLSKVANSPNMSGEEFSALVQSELRLRADCLPPPAVLVLAALLRATSAPVAMSVFYLRYVCPAMIQADPQDKAIVAWTRSLQVFIYDFVGCFINAGFLNAT